MSLHYQDLHTNFWWIIYKYQNEEFLLHTLKKKFLIYGSNKNNIKVTT